MLIGILGDILFEPVLWEKIQVVYWWLRMLDLNGIKSSTVGFLNRPPFGKDESFSNIISFSFMNKFMTRLIQWKYIS